MSEPLSLAHVISPTEAEGPGRRMAIWVQGCPLRCPGCCNPEMLAFAGDGARGFVSSAAAMLERAQRERESIEGLSFLGGEPFAQAAALAELARGAQSLGLSVMVYSGFTLGELRDQDDTAVDALLAATDLLVDGPYDRSQPDEVRRWVGSRNQVVHFLSDRYQPSDPRFVGRDTFEIRMTAGAVTVNGWPASSAQLTRLLARQSRRE